MMIGVSDGGDNDNDIDARNNIVRGTYVVVRAEVSPPSDRRRRGATSVWWGVLMLSMMALRYRRRHIKHA